MVLGQRSGPSPYDGTSIDEISEIDSFGTRPTPVSYTTSNFVQTSAQITFSAPFTFTDARYMCTSMCAIFCFTTPTQAGFIRYGGVRLLLVF